MVAGRRPYSQIYAHTNQELKERKRVGENREGGAYTTTKFTDTGGNPIFFSPSPVYESECREFKVFLSLFSFLHAQSKRKFTEEVSKKNSKQSTMAVMAVRYNFTMPIKGLLSGYCHFYVIPSF